MTVKKNNTIFAIGYSNRSIDSFIKLLKFHNVNMLVDVRTIPKSRHQPDFNEQKLSKRLKREGMRYLHAAELGGLRRPLASSVNNGWRNNSFRGFADYMQTRAFVSAISKLIKFSKNRNIVIMCAEGNPFGCHRSLIADALTIRGINVFHITGLSSVRLHTLTPFAKVHGKKITYPKV